MCNVAIARYATAIIKEERGGSSLTSAESDSPLLRAVLKRSALTDVSMQLTNDYPMGAGLGGSSAATAAMLTAVAEWRGETWDRSAVAEAGRRIEVEDLGIAGGRQDHYAATFGGALALTFTSNVSVRRIPISQRTCDDFVSRSLLVYTGESRISGDTITAVLGAYEAGDKRVVRALYRMRELAQGMAAALERADFDGVGAMLDEHWEFQRMLHPTIPTPLIDEIVSRARSAGALGSKAMGASGGGCVLIISPADQVERVRRSVAGLGVILDFRVDCDGVALIADNRS